MENALFEQQIGEAYNRFAPLAKCYYYNFRRTSVTSGGVPTMIFLGNHSAGKSSLVNWVLGGEPVQDVGLAPTDDGFTAIVWGETEDDISGPAALKRLGEEFSDLQMFGPSFLQRLKVKVRRREILKTVTLIDSPGMIDSAKDTVDRSYDFEGVVKFLAELCDMVFFLLDPDKPGTTGETVNIFAKCLSGVEFKLRVLLNKCDEFSSMHDFARTYGTVCWNLARVLHTKDLPKIWTLYSGENRGTGNGERGTGLDLAPFNAHRAEFLQAVAQAAVHRRDNLFAQAAADFTGLSVRMCIMNHAARRIAFSTILAGAIYIAAAAAAAFCAAKAADGAFLSITLAAAAILGVSAISYFAWRLAIRRLRKRLALGIDTIFALEYRRDLAAATHHDLSEPWSAIRAETARLVESAPLHLPFFGEFQRRKLDRAAKKLWNRGIVES